MKVYCALALSTCAPIAGAWADCICAANFATSRADGLTVATSNVGPEAAWPDNMPAKAITITMDTRTVFKVRSNIIDSSDIARFIKLADNVVAFPHHSEQAQVTRK